jgi:Uma2 family endonuclease
MEALTLSLDSIIEITDEQFFQICQRNSELRFERNAEGDISIMQPVGSPTGMYNADFNGYLWSWNHQKKLGYTFDSSAGFTLPNRAMRSPDAAWILKARWEALTPDQQSRFAPICPDFVMELLFPGDRLSVAQAKMLEYQANGVRLGWLINRKVRTVEVYRINQLGEESMEVLQSPNQLTGEDVLLGFESNVTALWA